MSDIVSQFIEITGLSKNFAESVLKLNDNNLELAINYHLENGSANGVECDPDSEMRNYLNDMPSLEPLDSSIETNQNSNHIKKKSDFIPKPVQINSDSDLMEIRPPIPSKREQLLQPDEDQFRFLDAQNFNLPMPQYDPRRKRRIPFTVCPFRDFSREAELQEEELIEISTAKKSSENFHTNTTHIENINSSSSLNSLQIRKAISKNNNTEINSKTNNKETNSKNRSNSNMKQFRCDKTKAGSPGGSDIPRKHRRLDDLFRPPTDLLFCGTFQGARDFAKLQNRWMLVNLQDQCEFKSQILNRDIWPDPKLRELIKSYFVLWQVSVENREGVRFKIFYHCENVPYVCIIDPRTGEEKLKCETNSLKDFYSELMRFLSENSYNLDATVPEKKRRITTSTSTSNSSNSYVPPYSNNELELSEQDQIELAIMKSLNEPNSSAARGSEWNDDYREGENSDFNHSSLKTFDNSATSLNNENSKSRAYFTPNSISQNLNIENTNSEESKSDRNVNISDSFNALKFSSSYLDYLGSRHDPLTQIQIRISEQNRETLKWPASTRIAALKLFIIEKLMPSKFSSDSSEPVTIDSVKLIRSYPRQNIFELNQNLTLMEANLHPTSILYLHLDE